MKGDDISKSFILFFSKISILICACLAMVIFIMRDVHSKAEKVNPLYYQGGNRRTTESLNYLRKSQSDFKQLIIYHGDSVIEYGFDPIDANNKLEALGDNRKLINLGIRGFRHRKTGIILDKIGDIFRESSSKLPVFIYNISPEYLTQSYEERLHDNHDLDQFLQFLEVQTIWKMSDIDIFEKMRLIIRKKVLGGIYQGAIYSYTRFILHSQLNKSLVGFVDNSKNPYRFINRTNGVWSSHAFNPMPIWNPERLGGFVLPTETDMYFKQVIQDFKDPFLFDFYVKKIVQPTYDAQGLHLSSNLLKMVRENISIIKGFSNRVVMTVLPYSPRGKMQPGAVESMKKTMRSIAQEQGVELYFIDEYTAIEENDFWDYFHLSEQGSKKLSDFIVHILKKNREASN